MIVHATDSNGAVYARQPFAGELFCPGQLLDATRYYIIIPDAIGHGKSTLPSDGLHAGFPHYDYDDMVEAEHLLLTERLRVDHLRLDMGMSMGCMHAFIFAEKYPDFLDAAMPMGCSVVEIAGRSRIFRKVLMDNIRNDPGYQNGEYKQQPAALRTVLGLMLVEITTRSECRASIQHGKRLMLHSMSSSIRGSKDPMRMMYFTPGMPRGAMIHLRNWTRSRLPPCGSIRPMMP